SVLTLVGSFDQLFSYVIFVAWIFYGFGGLAVLVLGQTSPNVERPYKTWGYPIVPLLFALGAFLIVLNTMANDFKRGQILSSSSFWGLVLDRKSTRLNSSHTV